MTSKEQLILHMYESDKRKRLIVVIIIFLAIIVSIVSFFVISSLSFKLETNEKIIEYGKVYTPSVADFCELNDKVTTKNTSVEYNIECEPGKDFPALGEYPISISHTKVYSIFNKQFFSHTFIKTAKVFVKDTIAPEFTESVEKITVVEGEELTEEAIKEKFKATDISGEVAINVDGTVDTSTVGEYTITITASDKANNMQKAKCVVFISSAQLKTKETQIELIQGETAKIEYVYTGVEKVEYKNSDSNIVVVDSEGNITAKNVGKCVIILSAGKTSDSCTITVTKKAEQATTVKQEASTTKRNNTTSTHTETTTTKSNTNSYPNKDFLFSDGYTMNNVTQAAYNYLKSSGKPGSCIPLKNSEGIYIGMRVVFN